MSSTKKTSRFLVPQGVLFLTSLGLLVEQGGGTPAVLLFVAASTLLLIGVTLGGVALRERRVHSMASPGDLYRDWARFDIGQAPQSPFFRLEDQRSKLSRVRWLARGMIEGTLTVRDTEMIFSPGFLASRDGVIRAKIAISEITNWRLRTLRGSLASEFRLHLSDGTTCAFEVRGPQTLKTAMAKLAPGSPNDDEPPI